MGHPSSLFTIKSVSSAIGLAALVATSSFVGTASADEWQRPAPRRVYKDAGYDRPMVQHRPRMVYRPRVEYRAPRHYGYRAYRPRHHVGYRMAAPVYARPACSYGYQDHVSCGNGYQDLQMRAYQPAPVYYQAAPSYSAAASYGAAYSHYSYPGRGYSYGYATSTLGSPPYGSAIYNRPCLC